MNHAEINLQRFQDTQKKATLAVRESVKVQALSKYNTCPQATNDQKEGFIKTVSALYPSMGMGFWSIIRHQILNMSVSYQQLEATYQYLLHEHKYSFVTPRDILNPPYAQIPTIEVDKLGYYQELYPTCNFAILTINNKKYYCKESDAKLTGQPYILIKALNPAADATKPQ